ncbi:MAG: universal stress protein [Ectothiorhodospiraceae bacterium]|jgi:nucleotide-binding universal stress UspA family protein
MENILLAVDGSDHGSKAAGYAGDLASKYGARVTVLHVLDRRHLSPEHKRMAEVEHMADDRGKALPWVENAPAELASMLQGQETVEHEDEVLRYLGDKVARAATDELTAHGVSADSIRLIFKNGDPVERIIETAKETGADAIVLGSRGLSEVSGLAFGSVSHKVSHIAPCTVITVK